MLWVSETHLPAWPAGPNDGMTVRAVRAARDVVRRLHPRVPAPDERLDEAPFGGDAA